MVVFAALVAALLIAGTWVAGRLWRDEETTPLERIASGAILALAFWIGVSWILALTHTLTATALWIVSGLVLAAAVAIVLRNARAWNAPVAPAALLLAPVLLWGVFALWRGAVLPPSSHDALAYHLPRAVFMARAHGFAIFPAPDARLNLYPANYELLLTDVILMSGSDRLTEWVSTVLFGLFLLTAAAMAQRWWPRKPAAIAVVLATATTPILLLHSSAHKNDVMTATLGLTALLWGARWYARGGRTPMLLLVASLVLAGGTKPQATGVMLGLAPFLLARVFREVRARRLSIGAIAMTGLLAVAFFAIAGAAPYVAPFLAPPAPGTEAPSGFGWGDFANLWQVPILLWLAPFSPHPYGVFIPWRGAYWFWPRYEIFFSNWGMLFSLLALALPFGIRASRRDPDLATRRERFAGGIAALLACAVLLPTEIRPVGFFGSFGRYLLFVVPVVIVMTIPPIAAALDRPRLQRLPAVLAAALAVIFTGHAIVYAIHDSFAPLAYVRVAAELPGTRTIWFEANRAASVADRMAGPRDTIAVAGAFDTWIHPAFGAELTRNVILLRSAATARDLPPGTQWVIVDRSWNAIWSHPKLTDMGQFWEYIGRGEPTAEDLQLYRQLLRDPRFRLVYRNPRLNQAVFWRIGSTSGNEPPEWRGPR